MGMTNHYLISCGPLKRSNPLFGISEKPSTTVVDAEGQQKFIIMYADNFAYANEKGEVHPLYTKEDMRTCFQQSRDSLVSYEYKSFDDYINSLNKQ